MRNLFIFLIFLTLTSCSVEKRIKDHSYTEEWHFENGTRYQVYKTKTGRKYIIVFTRNNYNLKRKYIRT